MLPIALRGLASLLGRGAMRSSGQSALGRELGKQRMMPFMSARPTQNEANKRLLKSIGIGGPIGGGVGVLLASLLGKKPKEEMDVRRPSLMGIDEPSLSVDDLVRRGGTNEVVRTGPDLEEYLTRGEQTFDDQGRFIKPGDRMPDTGEIDLLRLLGIR